MEYKSRSDLYCCIAKIHKFLINHTVSAVFCKAARRRRAKKPSHFLRWREGWVLVYHKKTKKWAGTVIAMI